MLWDSQNSFEGWIYTWESPATMLKFHDHFLNSLINFVDLTLEGQGCKEMSNLLLQILDVRVVFYCLGNFVINRSSK